MSKIKLGFLKSSTSSTDNKTFLIDNTSKSSWGGISSPKSKRFFTLRRKRNNSSQSQPELFDQENRSASPPRAINPLVAEVDVAALAMTSSISTTSSSDNQLGESLNQSPPAEIQTSHETGDRLLDEMTERVATIEDLDSMEKYNQLLHEREPDNLGRRKTMQDNLNGEMVQQDSLSYSHSSRSSIIASKIADSPPLAQFNERHEQEEQIQIQFADQRCRKVSKVSKFHHILEVLQQAARRVEADQSISQANIFRSLAPLAIFLYFIGIGVLLPRRQRYDNRNYSQAPEEKNTTTSVARMVLLLFVGMALLLVFLRGMVRVVSVLGKIFCEVDLTEIFRKGECVDVDGRGKGEAELILGGLFM